MSSINAVSAVVATKDYNAARAWYSRVLDREPDLEPIDGVGEWQLTDTGWLQLIEDADRAGASAVRIGVTDLAFQMKALNDAGIATGETVVIADMVVVLDIADPDGNEVSFVEDIEAADEAWPSKPSRCTTHDGTLAPSRFGVMLYPDQPVGVLTERIQRTPAGIPRRSGVPTRCSAHGTPARAVIRTRRYSRVSGRSGLAISSSTGRMTKIWRPSKPQHAGYFPDGGVAPKLN
jgi:hypothetical protein